MSEETRTTVSNEQLLKAIKKVHDEGGTRRDVVKELGLEEEKGYTTVTTLIGNLKKQGVNIPDLQRASKRSRRTLTTEEVEAYNAMFAGEVKEEPETPASGKAKKGKETAKA